MLQPSTDFRIMALTSDIWTSHATQGYITITAYYVSKDWKIQSYVLCTCERPERHTGIKIATRSQEAAEVRNIDDEQKHPTCQLLWIFWNETTYLVLHSTASC